MPAEGQADFAKWALSGEDIVLSMQHILQGEMIQAKSKVEQTPTGETYAVPQLVWVKVSDSLLNDTGIQQMTSLLYGFLNRSVFLSNLTEQRTMTLAQRILLSANKKLLLSTVPLKDANGQWIYKEFDVKIPEVDEQGHHIKDESGNLKFQVIGRIKRLRTLFDMQPEDYEQIISSLEGLLIPSLLRAYQEGERKFFAHTEQTVRQIIGTDKQQQNSGLFGGSAQR